MSAKAGAILVVQQEVWPAEAPLAGSYPNLRFTNWQIGEALAGDGVWEANYYHRWGWSHGEYYCGGLRGRI